MAKTKLRDLIEKLPKLQEGGIVTKSTLAHICQDGDCEIPLNEIQIREELIREQSRQGRLFISMLEGLSGETIIEPSKDDPYVYKTRKCFNCHRRIGFMGFFHRNDQIPLKQLEKIWESPYIELYCCECFRRKKFIEELEKKQERLLNKAERICEKFGYDLKWAENTIKGFGEKLE